MWGCRTEVNLVTNIQFLFLDTGLKTKENDFRALKDPARQVDMVYRHIKTNPRFLKIVAEPQDRKSNELSITWRTKGNDHYVRNKNFVGALECYTKSVAYAETGSSALALAYANRSAVLFEKQYYKQALEDISRALSLDYPEHLKAKLEARAEKAEKLNHNRPIKYYDPPPEIESKSPLISCASDALEIQYNEKYGRHIIATRDIEVGEVISAENSFCHVIHPESKYKHCHECLELCYNLIPCEGCVNAFYCSEQCKQRCFEEYHKYECKFPKALLSPEMIFVRLAVIGMEDNHKQDNKDAPSPSDVHRSDSFQEIIKLEMNGDKRNYANVCAPAIAAAIAFHILKNDDEFTSKYNGDSDDDTLKRIIYKAYMITNFNPFNIKKIKYTFLNVKSTRVGTALYAFTSLYNHSCVPNCEFFHYGTWIIARAQAFIKKGEQVTICYGKSFSTTKKSVRQSILKTNYMFDCDCKACENNWPTLQDLPIGKILPLAFEMKSFQNTFDNSDSNKKLMSELLEEGKVLLKALDKYQPCRNYLLVQDMITEIYTYQASRDVEF